MTLPGRLVLLGHPVSHSLSPRFQNAALREAGIGLTYEPLDVDPRDLPRAIAELVEQRAAGNVTVPHKAAVAELCSTVTAEAARAGVVNAFAVREGKLAGHNTDIAGFDHAARALLGATPVGLTVGLLGAGGVAAAVLAAVESWTGCSALVANRDGGRASALCARFSTVARVADADAIAASADLVVNATTLGMSEGDPLPIDPRRLHRARYFLDLVYSPDETPVVRAARQAGLAATDGLSMLVAQGAAAFSWWFGREPNVEVMWKAVGRSPRVET